MPSALRSPNPPWRRARWACPHTPTFSGSLPAKSTHSGVAKKVRTNRSCCESKAQSGKVEELARHRKHGGLRRKTVAAKRPGDQARQEAWRVGLRARWTAARAVAGIPPGATKGKRMREPRFSHIQNLPNEP